MVNKCHNIIPSVLSLSSLPCYPSFFFHPSSVSLFPLSYLLSSLFFFPSQTLASLPSSSPVTWDPRTTSNCIVPLDHASDSRMTPNQVKSNFCRSGNWSCTFWNNLSSGLALHWLLGDELWTAGIFTWSKHFCILSSWATRYQCSVIIMLATWFWWSLFLFCMVEVILLNFKHIPYRLTPNKSSVLRG